LTLGIIKAAGRPFRRRQAFRRGEVLKDLADLDSDLQRATMLFDNGTRSGFELHDRQTVSMLARAYCVPHAVWERRELPRALHLFETMLQQPADGVPLSHRWTCEAVKCELVARYGDANSGVARACIEHRQPHEQRVDLNTESVLAIADSAVQAADAPSHLERAVQLYLYVAHAAVRSGQALEHGDLDEQLGVYLAALTRLFGACSAARQLPQHTMLLLPALVGSTGAAPGTSSLDAVAHRAQDGAASSSAAVGGLVDAVLGATVDERTRLVQRRRSALNALIHACGRAGEVESDCV
jgi:hypothetical protein